MTEEQIQVPIERAEERRCQLAEAGAPTAAIEAELASLRRELDAFRAASHSVEMEDRFGF